MQDESYIPREFERPQLDITDMVASMQTEIKLRVHRSIMDRVLDYCTFDHFTPDGEEYYIVNYPFIERDYYYDMILSFGDKCECLEPPHVRAEIKRRIHELSKIYEN